MTDKCSSRLSHIVLFGCLSLTMSCDSGSKKAAEVVDKFAFGSMELARIHDADTLSNTLLENIHFTAQAQRILLSSTRPIMLSGTMSDLEATSRGWSLSIDRISYGGADFTFILECDSSMGARVFDKIKSKLDSSIFYDGPRLAVVANIRSVSKAIYSVDAEVYGSGDDVEYSFYLDVGKHIIARGSCLGYFLGD